MNDRPRSNTFNDEGRILQIEYAIKNVSKAGTMIGMVCSDGILLIGVKRSKTISKKNEKIYKISDNIYTVISGLYPDALQLIGYARVKNEEFIELTGSEMPIKSLAKDIGKLKQAFTQQKGMRPFGVCMLYAGILNDDYVLYSTLPSGSLIKWQAVCYGECETSITSGLLNDLTKQEYCLDEGTKEVIKILRKNKEVKIEDLDLIEMMHYKKDLKKILTIDEIKKYVEC